MTTTTASLLTNVPLHQSDYVRSVLSEVGQQLGPHGKQVPMPSATPTTVPHWPGSTPEWNIASPTYQIPTLEALQGNGKASGVTCGDLNMKTQSLHATPSRAKTKTYMMPPMVNHEDEKKRRNAIIARRNRVLNKRHSEDLQGKVSQLEEAREELCGVIQRLESELRTQHEKQREVHTLITELQSDQHSLQSLSQAQQKKLSFIREHLCLITGTLEEEDHTRRLLMALLQHMTTTSSSSSSTSPPAIASPSSLAASPPRVISPHRVTSPPQTQTVSPLYISSAPLSLSPPLSTSPPPASLPPPLPSQVIARCLVKSPRNPT